MMHTDTARVARSLINLAATIEVAPDGLTARVQSEEIEGESARDVARGLGSVLYHLAHVGRMEPITSRPRSYRDPRLERELTAATPHQLTPKWAELWRRDGDDVTIVLDGVRVRMPPGAVVDAGLADRPPARVRVEVAAVRPALSPGFFLADGSAGTGEGTETLRVYVGLTDPTAAVTAWRAVTTALEDLGAPYRLKVSSSPHLFPRRDALVVYLQSAAWRVVPELVSAALTVPGRTDDESVFAHRLAPGVAIAWEPQDPRPAHRGLSFGEHRSRAFAEAVVRAGTGAAADVGSAIVETFVNASIDPMNPARNLASPRIASM